MDRAEIAPYLENLRALPFVRGVRVVREAPPGPEHADYELSIRGPHEQTRVLVELKKTHVSPEVVQRLVGGSNKASHRLLFAPAVSQQLGDRLADLGIAFMDRAGNCYLNLSGNHVARIQGRRAERRAPADKAMRAPAYRALFALLADPELVRAPVRALAESAGVSRQAAFDIRPRLEGLGILYRTKKRFGWAPRGASKALDMFITGYATALKPQLTHGRYRTPGGDPGEIEAHIARALKSADEARWGGGAAAMRLTRYYRGERTVLHVDELRGDLLKRLKAIPDRNGPLELVRFPARLGREGATADTAHPLLVYAELMLEGQDRAAEAAQQILERWFPLERYT